MKVAVIVVIGGSLLLVGCGGGTRPVVAVVGDSITVLSAPGVVGELDGYAVYVRAEDGKRMDQMLPALAQEVRRHPEAIVVNLGTNDAVQARSHSDWLTGFDAAWDLVRSERCVVFVTVNTYADKIGRERVAFDMNNAMRRLASQHHNVRIVDWNAAVRVDGTLLASRNPPRDGIHPWTKRGWDWLGNHYRTALLSCGIHPS